MPTATGFEFPRKQRDARGRRFEQIDACVSRSISMPPEFDRPAASAARFVARIAARVRDALSRSAINRRVLRRLSRMSDRELAATGLLRQDVIAAASPETVDAIDLLLDRRAGRRP